MKIVTAGMAASVVIIASMFHPLVLHAAAFQHANIKLTVVADSPYNYEIKEVNLSTERLSSETLLKAHSQEHLNVSDNNEHMVIVTEQQTAATQKPDSCAATFSTEHGQVYRIRTQQAAQNSLAKCAIKTTADGSLAIVVSHAQS